MNIIYFWQLIKRQKLVISIFVLTFFVLGAGLTLIQPLKYSSSLRLLVVQSASNINSDPYAMARSNEYLSDVLSKVTYSTSFYSRVMSAGFNIDGAYFGNTNKKISKNWNKTIEVKKINNTGIISVTAYHPKQDQAEKIARGVGYVLITQNNNYHGLGDKVSLKLLDEPIASTWPVKPNLLLNAVLSLFLGLLFGLVYVYLLNDEPKAIFTNELSAVASAKGENYIEPKAAYASSFVEPKQSEDWKNELAKIQTEVSVTPNPFNKNYDEVSDSYRFIPEEPVSRNEDDWNNDWS